jgi:hypothetical protein
MVTPYVVLGCGDKKRQGWHRAVDLYVGPLYLSRLAYAQALGGPHAILSGLYGLIDPERRVPAYDFALTERVGSEREHWCETVAQQALFYAGDRPIVLLAAGAYLGVLRYMPIERASVPAHGMPIGKARSELARLTREVRPCHAAAARARSGACLRAR